MVTRVSAEMSFGFGGSIGKDCLEYYEHQLGNDDKYCYQDFEKPDEQKLEKVFSRDIKRHYNSTILHGDIKISEELYNFDRQNFIKSLAKNNFFAVSKQTTFLNCNANRKKNCQGRADNEKEFILKII